MSDDIKVPGFKVGLSLTMIRPHELVFQNSLLSSLLPFILASRKTAIHKGKISLRRYGLKTPHFRLDPDHGLNLDQRHFRAPSHQRRANSYMDN